MQVQPLGKSEKMLLSHGHGHFMSPADLYNDDVIMKRIEKRVWDSSYDLVKSHLMFAVREEVDVLKEQIRDLVERMSQLEYENGILRAAATPETLALLAQPRQPPPPSSS